MATADEIAQLTISNENAAASSAKHAEQVKKTDDTIKLLNNTLSSATGNLKSISDFTSSLVGGFISLGKSVLDINGNLSTMNTLTTTQANRLNLLAIAGMGVKDAFKDFGNLDGISLMGDQAKDTLELMGSLKDGASKSLDILKGIGSAFGIDPKIIQAVGEAGPEAMMKFAEKLLAASDNAQRLQSNMIQMGATTGSLGNIYNSAGAELENMNNLVSHQDRLMQGAADATGLSRNQVNSYYKELATIPGAMNTFIKGAGGAGDSTNMLAATIKMAAATGRPYKDLIDDLSKAYTNYGLTGENALKFTARISELSTKLGIPIGLVKSSIVGTSEAFKGLADAGENASKQSEGVAGIMFKYFDAIKNAGAGTAGAVSIIDNVTKSIGNLSIAQKSFLSQQTGGPGGLMGGFQIEKMLREGKTDQVFDLVRKQLNQQLGNIVTVDDASKSEAAAQQLQKQMLILQKGPLGSMAKTDQDAYRLLEGFKAVNSGTTTSAELSKSIVQDQVNQGSKVQSLSNTPLSSIRNMLESAKYNVNVMSYSAAQNMLAERKGYSTTANDEKDSDSQKKMRNALNKNITNANSGEIDEGAAVAALNSVKALVNNNVKDMLPGIVEGGRRMVFPTNQGSTSTETNDRIKAEIESKKTENNKPLALNNLNVRTDTSQNVLEAAMRASTKPDTESAMKVANTNMALAQNKPLETTVNVNVKSICTVCGHDVENSQQVLSNNPTVRN